MAGRKNGNDASRAETKVYSLDRQGLLRVIEDHSLVSGIAEQLLGVDAQNQDKGAVLDWIERWREKDGVPADKKLSRSRVFSYFSREISENGKKPEDVRNYFSNGLEQVADVKAKAQSNSAANAKKGKGSISAPATAHEGGNYADKGNKRQESGKTSLLGRFSSWLRGVFLVGGGEGQNKQPQPELPKKYSDFLMVRSVANELMDIDDKDFDSKKVYDWIRKYRAREEAKGHLSPSQKLTHHNALMMFGEAIEDKGGFVEKVRVSLIDTSGYGGKPVVSKPEKTTIKAKAPEEDVPLLTEIVEPWEIDGLSEDGRRILDEWTEKAKLAQAGVQADISENKGKVVSPKNDEIYVNHDPS